jgi:Cu(I)/Ag(I) efflux system membrane fusion protein
VGDALEAYESLRVKLAQDDASAAPALAEKLAASATKAAAAATGPTQQPLKDLAAAADKMKALPATDMAGIRGSFGDASKAMVALLVADPSLQTGRFLFMCPMAKGYQKWVQTDQKLRNPYYGNEMLECGEQLPTWSV